MNEPAELPALRLIFDAVPAMIWFKDDKNRILRCNRAAAEARGMAVSEMEGRPTEEIYPDEAAKYLADDLVVIRSGEPRLGILELHQMASGKKHWVRTDKIPYRDASGQVVGVVVFALDITAQKDAEAALRESEDRLRQAQKMEAIGRLAGGVAHDFNNLLTIIRGRASLLAGAFGRDDPRSADAGEILDASERAVALTRQLLLFSRKQVLCPERLDLDAVVVDLARLLRRVIGEDVAFDCAPAAGSATIAMDRAQLEQVLVNLAVNARDAMPGGGALKITTEADSEWVTLRVVDTGCGMDPSTLARAFEPYFTTKEHGTGLGLATVYGIVTGAGGRVQLVSRAGEGTTCVVSLPRVAEPPAPGPTYKDPADLRGTGTVLLVEDEVAVRRLATDALRRYGYEVIAAGDAREALRICDERAHPPALMVTDVVLPGGVNGRELADLVRVRWPGLRVLFMSGHAEDEVLHRGVSSAEMAFLHKPFTPEELARAVLRA